MVDPLKITMMDKEQFILHFKLALVHLNAITRQFCFNELSANYKFILEPNSRTTSDHLTTAENEYVRIWNRLKDKQITFEEVVNLFFKDGKTPKWADCNIYHSTKDLTVVKIFFSRQFRDESEIYYLERGTGPFKAVVAMPPDNSALTKNDKFDLNWQKTFHDNKNIWTKLKRLLISG